MNSHYLERIYRSTLIVVNYRTGPSNFRKAWLLVLCFKVELQFNRQKLKIEKYNGKNMNYKTTLTIEN